MESSNKFLGAYWIFVLAVFLFAAVPAMGESTGTTGAAFLKVAVGPRAAAMGSAYAAVAEEPYAAFYNPASIAPTERWLLSAMHQDQFAQVNFDYVGLAAPAWRGRSAWGFSIVRMASTDYFRTELDDGAKFVNEDLALTGTYAHRIFKPLSLGASFKIIRQTLAGYKAGGWALDVGTHLRVNPRLSLGASLVNMGPKITFISIGDPLPTTFRVGGAFKLLPRGNLLATADYWIPKDDADGIGLGIEYRPNRFIALRGGYGIGTDFTGFDASTYGLTFNFENFGIEYAFVPREKLGDVHRAGLNVTFGGKPPEVIAAKSVERNRRRRPYVAESAPPVTSPSRRSARVEQESYYEEPARVSEQPAESAESVESAEAAPEATVQAEEPSGESAEPSPQTPKSMADFMSLRTSPGPAKREGSPAVVPAKPAAAVVKEPAAVKAPAARIPAAKKPAVASAARPVQAPVQVPAPVPAVAEAPVEITPASDAGGSRSAEIVQEKVSLAANLMKQQRFQEAVSVIQSGLRVDPKNVPLWYLLSESYYKIGDYDASMEAVSKALAIIQGDRVGGR